MDRETGIEPALRLVTSIWPRRPVCYRYTTPAYFLNNELYLIKDKYLLTNEILEIYLLNRL